MRLAYYPGIWPGLMASTYFRRYSCCAQVEVVEVIRSLDCCCGALRAMEGRAMSLSAWEQQTLDSIRDGLAGSDPELVALLTTFTRLAADEEMPAREEIPAGSGRTTWRSPRTPRHRCRAGGCPCSRPMPSRVRVQWVVMLVWLVVTVMMITAAVVMTRGGSQGSCQGAWPVCTHSAPG
jgi:hypothetical protein